MKISDYLLKFKNRTCPYCGKKKVNYFVDGSGMPHSTFIMFLPYSEGHCYNCGAIVRKKNYMLPLIMFIVIAIIRNAVPISIIFIMFIIGIISLIPVKSKYISDYKHPELGTPEDWRSPKKYADKDIDDYKVFANFVFSLIDGGLLHVGYKSKNYDFISLCSQQLKEILEQNNYSMTLIVLDKDVILFQTDNVTKAFCGIAATRNGVAPEDSENTPEFDKYLFYQKIKDNIYYFQGEI